MSSSPRLISSGSMTGALALPSPAALFAFFSAAVLGFCWLPLPPTEADGAAGCNGRRGCIGDSCCATALPEALNGASSGAEEMSAECPPAAASCCPASRSSRSVDDEAIMSAAVFFSPPALPRPRRLLPLLAAELAGLGLPVARVWPVTDLADPAEQGGGKGTTIT